MGIKKKIDKIIVVMFLLLAMTYILVFNVYFDIILLSVLAMILVGCGIYIYKIKDEQRTIMEYTK